MKKISYLDMIKELLGDEEFLKFQKCYNNPIKKSIKILDNRWFKNIEIDLYDKVKSIISEQRDLAEPDFSYNWNKYKDVLYAIRKEWLFKSSLWSHYLHQAWFIYVQEMAASIPVQVLWIKPWDKVLDMCAAPWWKSIQIADKLTDWFLISNEIDFWRRKALKSNLQRCWIFNAWIIGQDGCKLWDIFPENFDKVIVDAPCSWEWMQYKSDKKVWQRDEKKSKKLSDLQIKLLISWLKSLKVWWELVYSTCTTNVIENESVVSEVIKQFWDKIQLLEVPLDEKSNWISNWRWNEVLSEINAKKVARLRPHIHQTWGFFIAKFKKVKSLDSPTENKNNNSAVCNNVNTELILQKLSERWIHNDSKLSFFVSKYTINVAPKKIINNHFENKISNIEIWLPIFKIINNDKNKSQELIPLIWLSKVFWQIVTKNFIDIDGDQLGLLMKKSDMIDERLKEYEWKHVILKRNWLWAWLVSVQKWIWKNKCF